MTIRSSLYTHTQEELSENWVVAHGLKAYPTVEAFTIAGESHKKIIPARVTYADKCTCILEFITPQLGIAITI